MFNVKSVVVAVMLASASLSVSAATLSDGVQSRMASAAATDRLEVIISLRGGKPKPQQLAQLQATGAVLFSFPGLPVIGAKATPEQIRTISQMGDVRAIELSSESAMLKGR